MDNDNICGAKTKKDGSPCQRAPVQGRNRCHLHGGAQKRGGENANYKHGLYSKYAGAQLKEVLSQLEDVGTEELVQPDNEIKLMQALILKCKAMKDGSDDLDELDTISKVIDRLVKAKQRSQAIMLEQNRLIPATDVKIFITYTKNVLMQRIEDSEARQIIEQLENFKISDHENR